MTFETYFLGQILWDPLIVTETRLVPSDFSDAWNRVLFQAMLLISQEGLIIDEMALSTRLNIPLSEIMPLKSVDILSANWKATEKLLVGISKRRSLMQLLDSVSRSQDLPVEHLVEQVRQGLDGLECGSDGYAIAPMEETVLEAKRVVDERYNRKEFFIGIRSNLNQLDQLTLGFQPGKLYVLGARPSQGKTALLLNFALACNGLPVGFISAESSRAELGFRMISIQSHIDTQRVCSGKLTQKEYERVWHASEALYDRHRIFTFDEPNTSIDTAVSMARHLKLKHGIRILFVDYLQCFKPSKAFQAKEFREQIAYSSKMMKELARTLEIPVVVAVQLRRDAEGKSPKLNDFSDSTQIERDADVAILIHNTKLDSDENRTWLIIAKNRDGRTGDIEVKFDRSCLTFRDIRDSV